MASILAALRKQTNGMVSDSMREKGLEWGVNYGVSIPAIRSVASMYAPDHALGTLLYRQQIRELRLAGIMIADPQSMTRSDLPFWEEGIVNTEIAEHFSIILSQSPTLAAVSEKWILSGNDFLVYAALLANSRRILNDRYETGNSLKILDGITLLKSDNRFVLRSVATFLNALYRFSTHSRDSIKQTVDALRTSLDERTFIFLEEELFLESDQ